VILKILILFELLTSSCGQRLRCRTCAQRIQVWLPLAPIWITWRRL